jgi:hypothetical protein
VSEDLRRRQRWAQRAQVRRGDPVKESSDARTRFRNTLYNLLDRRHGHVSTAVTSNIALSDWGRYLGDVTLTAAILDRLACTPSQPRMGISRD